MPQHQQLLVTEAGVRGHQHWNTTTTITADSAAKATNLRPAKLPQVPTNERLSFAVDQFTGSGQPQHAGTPRGTGYRIRTTRTRPHPQQIRWPTPTHTGWAAAQSHARTGDEESAVPVGSDAANPDAALPVTRPGHDLATKPGDLGGMHCRINPPGDPHRPPYAPENRHVTRHYGRPPTLAAAVDDSTLTVVSALRPPSACETSDETAAPSEPSAREPFPESVPDTGAAA